MAKSRLVTLPGHFAHPVRVDSVEEIGAGFFLLKVRDSSGPTGIPRKKRHIRLQTGHLTWIS
jgi:hypothetical protein